MANGDVAPEAVGTDAPIATRGGGVDLNSPFFRRLEVERGLPSGVLSAMAEKESGGNALKGATDPNSSARGLFQITNATARDWGLSPDDRLDPVKSAMAVADTLARRANQVGPERAVGMHYGGPGAAWDTPVGTSGLSPAGYSADVFQRAQKYANAEPQIGYPSPAFAEEPAQAQPQAQEQNFYRQYLQSTAPDGSTTIREIVSPNLLDHDAAVAAEKQAGHTFQNFVDPAKMAGVQTTAAPPAQAQPETPLLPSAIVPTSGSVPTRYTAPPPDTTAAPGSSPWLNLIPPALATVGPLALAIAQPELGIPAWLASGGLAALGGGGGEAIREKAAGEELSPRNIATQGAVSGLTDVGMSQVINPYVVGPMAKFVTGRLGPVLGSAEELGPTLTSEGTTVAAPAASLPPPPLRVTGVHTIDLATAPSTEALNTHIQALARQATEAERPALAAAWVASVRQRAANSGNPITYMRAAYEGLGEQTQADLFGSQKGAFENLLGSAWGGTPGEAGALTATSVAQGGGGYLAHELGIPHIPGLAGTRIAGNLAAPFAARGMLVSPGAARFGAGLSSFGGVAGPAASNLAAQSVAERARQAGLPTF